jgi:hypothetical protein
MSQTHFKRCHRSDCTNGLIARCVGRVLKAVSQETETLFLILSRMEAVGLPFLPFKIECTDLEHGMQEEIVRLNQWPQTYSQGICIRCVAPRDTFPNDNGEVCMMMQSVKCALDMIIAC